MKRAVALACLALACAPPVEVGPPPRPDATRSTLDPMVAERIGAALDRVTSSPDDAEARGRLGMLYHEHGLPDLAATTYEQAAALDPSDPRWPYHLGQVSVELGQAERGLLLYDHVLELAPDALQAHRTRGFLLIDVNRMDQAEAAFRDALALDPSDPGARVGMARVFLSRGENREALGVLQKLVAEVPNEPYLHQLLGTAHQRLGNLADARKELTQSRGVAPKWRDPWREERASLLTGMLPIIRTSGRLLEEGRGAEALALLRDLQRYHPDDVVVLNTLASTLLQLGQRDEALQLLQRALELDPRSFETHVNLSHWYETQRPPDRGRAMEHALESVAINPTFAAGHLQVGRLRMQQSDYAGAAVSLRDALSYGEDDPEVRTMYGWVLGAQERWSEALRVFQQVIQQRPEAAGAFVGIARATMEMGMVDQAARPLRQAQLLDPENPELRRTIERYRQLGGQVR